MNAGIVRRGAVEGLRDAWRTLWLRIPGAYYFSHPDWLLPWWATLGGATSRISQSSRQATSFAELLLWHCARRLSAASSKRLGKESATTPTGSHRIRILPVLTCLGSLST